MATEEGIVIKTDSQTAWVKTMRTAACEGCAAKEGCHPLGGGKEMEIEAINMVGAKVGDMVLIGFETSSLVIVSFLVYVFPILSMIAGAVMGQKIAPDYQLDGPTLPVILGLLFFLIAFFIIKLIGKKLSAKEDYRARIVRIKIPGFSTD